MREKVVQQLDNKLVKQYAASKKEQKERGKFPDDEKRRIQNFFHSFFLSQKIKNIFTLQETHDEPLTILPPKLFQQKKKLKKVKKFFWKFFRNFSKFFFFS